MDWIYDTLTQFDAMEVDKKHLIYNNFLEFSKFIGTELVLFLKMFGIREWYQYWKNLNLWNKDNINIQYSHWQVTRNK